MTTSEAIKELLRDMETKEPIDIRQRLTHIMERAKLEEHRLPCRILELETAISQMVSTTGPQAKRIGKAVLFQEDSP